MPERINVTIDEGAGGNKPVGFFTRLFHLILWAVMIVLAIPVIAAVFFQVELNYDEGKYQDSRVLDRIFGEKEPR